jgi:hypothetical protein
VLVVSQGSFRDIASLFTSVPALEDKHTRLAGRFHLTSEAARLQHSVRANGDVLYDIDVAILLLDAMGVTIPTTQWNLAKAIALRPHANGSSDQLRPHTDSQSSSFSRSPSCTSISGSGLSLCSSGPSSRPPATPQHASVGHPLSFQLLAHITESKHYGRPYDVLVRELHQLEQQLDITRKRKRLSDQSLRRARLAQSETSQLVAVDYTNASVAFGLERTRSGRNFTPSGMCALAIRRNVGNIAAADIGAG